MHLFDHFSYGNFNADAMEIVRKIYAAFLDCVLILVVRLLFSSSRHSAECNRSGNGCSAWTSYHGLVQSGTVDCFAHALKKSVTVDGCSFDGVNVFDGVDSSSLKWNTVRTSIGWFTKRGLC